MNLEDFDRTFTGYTNKYLEDRNNLKTQHKFKGDTVYEQPREPGMGYSYSVIKDLQKTPLSLVYFSQKNLDYLQDAIKKVVHKESGHIIGRQSDVELLTIMRSYYLSDGKNLPYEIDRQVAELNYLVIKYAVFDQILPKVKGYGTFLNDNLRTNVMLPREEFISNRGARINRGFSDLI